MKYIDAEKLKKIVEQAKQRALKGMEIDEDMYCDGRADAFGEVLLEIENLQQEQPEVDLIAEYDEQFDSDPVYGKLANRNAGIAIARHFYNLGLNSKK